MSDPEVNIDIYSSANQDVTVSFFSLAPARNEKVRALTILITDIHHTWACRLEGID